MKSLTTLTLLVCSGLYLSAQNCMPPTSQSTLDINNVSALVMNGGDLWWDFSDAAYEVPKGSGKHPLFSGALWMGGYDQDGNLSTAAMKFRQTGVDFWAGPINNEGGTTSTSCQEFDRSWKINRTDIEAFLNGSAPTEPMIMWPAKGNAGFSYDIEDLAPFHDENADGIYDTDDGDYPLIKGDQAIFYVFNDMGNLHTESGGNPFGIEVHLMIYGYKSLNATNNATYYDYTIINKGEEDFEDVFIGQFTDVDLGNSLDDYVGVDVSRNMAYSYNGDAYDDGPKGYGSDLPILGIRTNHSPNGQGMHNFCYLTNTPGHEYSLPNYAPYYYNFLSGKTRSGFDRVDSDSNVTMYTYDGVPGGNGHDMCSEGLLPADFKMLQSYGPIDLNSGDIVGFSYSVVFAQDSSFNGGDCPDITAFNEASDIVDEQFEEDICALFDLDVTASVTPALGGAPEGAITIVSTGATGMFNYEWSTGASGISISDLEPDTYEVTITNAFGCEHIESIEVSESAIGVDELNRRTLKVFPNPASSSIRLAPAPVNGTEIQIQNTLGRLVRTTTYQDLVNVEGLATGTYILSSEGMHAIIQIH